MIERGQGISPVEKQPRKRRRGLGFGILLGGILLLVVAAIVLDGVARGYVATVIQSKVRSSLSLPASTPVEVTVGGVSVLLQLATGSLERVDVAVKSLPVGTLTGDATLTATGVPLDTSKPIAKARVVFSAGVDQVKQLLAGYGSVPIGSVALANGALQVGTEFSVLGVALPVSVALTPSAVGGKLALTPRELTVNGAILSPAKIRANFGSIADTVLATRTICVAKYLPKSFILDAVAVKGTRVELAVIASSVLVNSSLLSQKGSCP